ncbi:hypothetical protein V6N13_117879 [Hibiscus sabdariffa]
MVLGPATLMGQMIVLVMSNIEENGEGDARVSDGENEYLLLFESQTKYQNSYFGRGIKSRIHRVRLIDLLFMPSNSFWKMAG